ncbi:MAG: nicotinate (nicotinamide) nucleotide adenylyltransferase [Alloprevotella sp.]
MMKRVALFGGSFNPIHLGHLALAREVVRWGLADETWLMVSPHNPLKPSADLLDEILRFEMARIATADQPAVRASDFEFTLPRPSFTWRTLEALRLSHPDTQFALLVGADNWACFNRWAHYEEILQSTPIIIYPREGYEIEEINLPAGVTLLNPERLYPFSSTDIRRAFREGADVSRMLPPAVEAFIRRRGLYGARPS